MAKQSEQSCQINNVQNNVLEFKNMNARFKTNIQQLEKEKKKYKQKKHHNNFQILSYNNQYTCILFLQSENDE